MTTKTEVLVRILGAIDAIHAPVRCWSGTVPSNAYTARGNFERYGAPWRSAGSDDAERKRQVRALAALRRAGLVTAYADKTKTLYAKLSGHADEQVRQTCGLPGAHCGWLTTHRVQEVGANKWVPEARLAGFAWGNNSPEALAEFGLVESMALPGLWRGWLESASDRFGHVYYRSTEAGREVLAAGEPDDADDPPANPEARALYIQARDAELRRLSGPAMNERELGYLPLPASMGGLAVSPISG